MQVNAARSSVLGYEYAAAFHGKDAAARPVRNERERKVEPLQLGAPLGARGRYG